MLTTEWGPVGTRGGCGDGWGPGACPDGNAIHWRLRGANRSHPNEDKLKAPSSTPPLPLSVQDPAPQAPQWIGLPRFGRQHSSGLAFFALTGYITNDISTKYIDASHIGGTNGHRACFWVGTGLSQASGARPALEDLDSPGSQ